MANTASSSPRFTSPAPHGPGRTPASPSEAAGQDARVGRRRAWESAGDFWGSSLPWDGCRPLFLVTVLPGVRARAGDKAFPLQSRGSQENKSHAPTTAVQGAAARQTFPCEGGKQSQPRGPHAAASARPPGPVAPAARRAQASGPGNLLGTQHTQHRRAKRPGKTRARPTHRAAGPRCG